MRTTHDTVFAACMMVLGAALSMPPSLRLPLMEQQHPHASTMANLYAVSDAAERSAEVFAAQYPEYGRVYGNLAGLTQYIPNGGLLPNPYTQARTEPSFADATGTNGAVGFTPIVQGGLNVGYTMNAARQGGAVLYTLMVLREDWPPVPMKLGSGRAHR